VHGSTYVYTHYWGNIIVEPCHPVLTAKAERDTRIANENSEDAVTWNVCRSIEWMGLTRPVLGRLFELGEDPEVYYWMHPKTEPLWSPYADAWHALEPGARRRHSEPDLVLVDDAHQRFAILEPKFGSPVAENNRPDWLVGKDYPASRRKMIREGYALGDADNLLFKSWEESIRAGFYQLTRQMLFGNYITHRHGYEFRLYSLISPGTNPRNEELCLRFKNLLTPAGQAHYTWLTWRDLYETIVAHAQRIPAGRRQHLDALHCYLRDKTFNGEPAHLLDWEDRGRI